MARISQRPKLSLWKYIFLVSLGFLVLFLVRLNYQLMVHLNRDAAVGSAAAGSNAADTRRNEEAKVDPKALQKLSMLRKEVSTMKEKVSTMKGMLNDIKSNSNI